MKIPKPLVYAFVLILLTALSACNRQSQQLQTVIINFEKAAETVNLAARVNEFSQTQTQAMNEKMAALSKKFKEQLEQEKSSHGDTPSEEQQKALATMTARLQKEFNQQRTLLSTRVRTQTIVHRQSIIDEIIPVARQIAGEHGASIVLKKNPVFWSDESLDITDEVISRLTAAQTTNAGEDAETAKPEEATE